ncbi:MAG: NlpC/P60 family protein, partial [Christensenellales bacterium]
SPMISTALRSGDKGASVERLQTRLFHLGYFAKASSVDGDYGGNTIAAVRLFQAEADLTADGTADAATLKAIYRSGAPALPSSKTPADQSSSGGGDSGGGSNSGVTRMPSGLASTTTSLGSGASSAQKIEYVIYNAQNQLGKPYIYGTAGPNSYDCSGLTTFAFKKANVSLGRSAYAQGYQANSGTKIESISDLKRGDIVCFDTVADSDLSDHVGIYLGQGYFIHASSGTGNGKQVCISSLSSGYYNRVFSWARRPLQ